MWNIIVMRCKGLYQFGTVLYIYEGYSCSKGFLPHVHDMFRVVRDACSLNQKDKPAKNLEAGCYAQQNKSTYLPITISLYGGAI